MKECDILGGLAEGKRGSYVPSLWRRIWYQSTPSWKMQCSRSETKKTIRKTLLSSKRIKTGTLELTPEAC